MSDQGRLMVVSDKTLGASLAVDHAVGAIDLLLDDTYVFEETGGEIAIILEDKTQTLHTYSTADDDASTLHLTAPTTLALDAGTRVAPWPLIVEKIGTVILGEGDPLPVLVPPELGSHPLLAEAVIPEPGLAVIVKDDPRGAHPLVLESITGYAPGVTSESLTGPAPDGWSDAPTVAPDIAPVISAAPYAIGTVRVSITPLDPVLQSRYEVAASLTSPVADGAVVGSTEGTTFDVVSVDGFRLPSGMPVYLKVRAVNVVGTGPWSTEVSAIPRQIEEFDIADFAVPVKKLHSLSHIIY